MNHWALITGASEGIGRELAGCFAADGFSLVLVARNQGRLEELAAGLKAKHAVETLVVAKDLARPKAAEGLFHAVGQRPVSALVNNAGFGAYGSFAGQALEPQSEMMQVNMVALTELTHLFVRPMLQRQKGYLLNVASTAAFQPGPRLNVYYASKAFVYSFSYALADELAGSGVTVTVLCPGLTRTEFAARAGLRANRAGLMMEPRRVAELGYHGLMRGRRVVIPGAVNQVVTFLSRRAPHWLTSLVVRRIHSAAA